MLRSLKLTTDCELPCLLMYAVAVQSLVLTSTSAPYQGEEVSENQEHCLKLEEFYVGSQTPPPPHWQILGGTPHKRTWSCTEGGTITRRCLCFLAFKGNHLSVALLRCSRGSGCPGMREVLAVDKFSDCWRETGSLTAVSQPYIRWCFRVFDAKRCKTDHRWWGGELKPDWMMMLLTQFHFNIKH